MTTRWEDLNARARGLGTRLLTPPELDGLARLPDVAELAAALRGRGYPLSEGESSPLALELATRRVAAERLRVLQRWCGSRADTLAVIFEDEDRRTLRAMIRGAVEGAPHDLRPAAVIPTPALPERAITTLAAQKTPAAIAALLVAWRNPYGSPLLGPASASQPDLFKLEQVVNRTFAERATRAARKTPALAAYVREVIDLENAFTAVVLASEGKDITFKDVFLPGGRRVSIGTFERAAATGDAAAAARQLSNAFSGSPLASAFSRSSLDPATLERTVLHARITAAARARRSQPLSPAPLLWYALRLRAETVDLRRIIWGLAFGAPADALVHEMATA